MHHFNGFFPGCLFGGRLCGCFWCKGQLDNFLESRTIYIFKFLNDLNPFGEGKCSSEPEGKHSLFDSFGVNIAFDVLKDRIVDGIVIWQIGRDGLLEDDILEVPDWRRVAEVDRVFGNQIIQRLLELAHGLAVLFLTHFHYPNIINIPIIISH